MHKTSRQRAEEELEAMPKWKRLLLWLCAMAMPFFGSINDFNF